MRSVLLVEDEPWFGELYSSLLQNHGFTVLWCRDGYDAIERLDKNTPNVIVLDLLLPWANGIQLLHELHVHADLRQIPVILCSNALPSSPYPLAEFGVVKALDKTRMKPADLIIAVKECL